MAAPFWRMFFRSVMRVTTLGNILAIDRRDSESQQMISPPGLYVANHQSFLDIPLLFSHSVIAPIMKKSLVYIPVFGLCAYASGAILVNRGKKSSRKKVMIMAMQRLLKGDRNMMYYPEGSRNRKSNSPKELTDIKTPIMKFAYDNNVTIYPVSLYGTNKMIKFKMIQYGTQVGIILHAGIRPSDFENRADFISAAWSKVQEGHRELSEKLTSE